MTLKMAAKNAQRATLLEIASTMLEQHGIYGLSVRQIAERANCSTMAIYTLFGGKDGLWNALYIEGFRRLTMALHSHNFQAPLEQIFALNHQYRHFALEQPMFYRLMFEQPPPEMQIHPSSRQTAWQSLVPLQNAIQAALAKGDLAGTSSEQLAMHLWLTAHGVVSLELAGYMPPDHVVQAESMLTQAIEMTLQKYRVFA
jgi:AcrR family transcriptional regulator